MFKELQPLPRYAKEKSESMSSTHSRPDDAKPMSRLSTLTRMGAPSEAVPQGL